MATDLFKNQVLHAWFVTTQQNANNFISLPLHFMQWQRDLLQLIWIFRIFRLPHNRAFLELPKTLWRVRSRVNRITRTSTKRMSWTRRMKQNQSQVLRAIDSGKMIYMKNTSISFFMHSITFIELHYFQQTLQCWRNTTLLCTCSVRVQLLGKWMEKLRPRKPIGLKLT